MDHPCPSDTPHMDQECHGEKENNVDYFLCHFWHSFRQRLSDASSCDHYRTGRSSCKSSLNSSHTSGRLPIEDFSDAFFASQPSLEELCQVYHDVSLVFNPNVLNDQSLNRIRIHGCLADLLWSLALAVFQRCLPELSQDCIRRSSGLVVQRLSNLESYAVGHVFQCLKDIQCNGMLSESQVYEFVVSPTRLFVILELTYIFEVCYYFRDAARSFSPLLVTCDVMTRPFTKHPLLSSLPEPAPHSTLGHMKFFESFASIFLNSLFYPIQEIVKKTFVHTSVSPTLIERCLILYIFTRVPAGASLRTYLPEMIPTLLTIFSNEDEFTVNMAHRLLFFIFKNFNRDFDAAESYLQLATYVYTQTLHWCTIQLKHWSCVLPIRPSGSSELDTPVCKEADHFFDPKDTWSEKGNQALHFLFIPEGTFVSSGRSSLSVIIEIPLIIMLLMRLQVAAVTSHAPIILERLLEFLAFTEPHKNCIRLQECLRQGKIPSESLTLLDFKTQRDLLDAQVKTIAFISFFLKGPLERCGGSKTVSGSVQGGCLDFSTASKSFSDIGSIIIEYLEIAPYQVGYASLAGYGVVEDEKFPNRLRLVPVNRRTFFNPNYDRVRSIYCRREILVSLRSILRSFEFRFLLPCSLSDFLQCWLHLGFGLEAEDYLKPFICQLRIELLGFLRTSTMLQRVLLVDASSMRHCRSECQQILTRSQADALRSASCLTPEQRSARLKYCFRFERSEKDDMGDLNSRVFSHGKIYEAHVVDCGGVSITSCSPDSPFGSISYGDLRALLLSRAVDVDPQHSAMLCPDKFLPLSLLSQLAQELCCDLHDTTISLYTESHIANSLAILVEWVDRFSLMDLRKRQATQDLGCLNQFMDPQEACNIYRRILESCCSKLWSLQDDLHKYLDVLEQRSVTEESASVDPQGGGGCGASRNSSLAKATCEGGDMFASPRQAAWVNPPLHYQKSAFVHGLNFMEGLTEIRVIVKTLCHVVRTSAFLLTAVGVSSGGEMPGGPVGTPLGCPSVHLSGTAAGGCTSEENYKKEASRLHHLAPLAEGDYQTVRDAFFYVVHLTTLYSNVMSRAFFFPTPWSSSATRFSDQGCWGHTFRSVTMSSSTQSGASRGGMCPNAEGHLPLVEMERQMLTLQQSERELYEAAVSILTTFHPVIMHRFFLLELGHLLQLVEEEPGRLVVFELLLQHPQISLTFRPLLVKYLVPLLPCLADPVFQESVWIPESLGLVISCQQSRRETRHDDNATAPEADPTVQVLGQLVHSSHDAVEASTWLTHLPYNTHIPRDIFNIPYNLMCPSRLILDPLVDFSAFSQLSLQWKGQDQGFSYQECPRASEECCEGDGFLAFCFPPNVPVLPDSVPGLPKTLLSPLCSHQASSASWMHSANLPKFTDHYESFFRVTKACNAEQWHHLAADGPGSDAGGVSHDWNPSGPLKRKTYRYIPCCASGKDSGLSAVYVNAHKEWLLATRTVLVSRHCPADTTPSLTLSDWLPSHCIAVDGHLVTSELWYPISPVEGSSAAADTPWTPVLGVEGLCPGVATLTHTASCHPRLPFVNLLVQLWKMCLSMGSRTDDREIWAMIQPSLPLCLCLCCHTPKCDALVFLIHYFFRFSMASSTLQSPQGPSWRSPAFPLATCCNAECSSHPFFCSHWFLSVASMLASLHPQDLVLRDTLSHICLIHAVSGSLVSTPQASLIPHLFNALSSRNAETVGAALLVLNTMTDTLAWDALLEYFLSPSQPGYDPQTRSSLFCKLVHLINARSNTRKSALDFFGDSPLVEVRDPVTGELSFQENRGDAEGSTSRNAFCFFSSRIIGKLSRMARTFLLAPPRLHSEAPRKATLGYLTFLVYRAHSQRKTSRGQFLDVTTAIDAAASTLELDSFSTPQVKNENVFQKFCDPSSPRAHHFVDFQQYSVHPLTEPRLRFLKNKVYPITTYPHQFASPGFSRYWSSQLTLGPKGGEKKKGRLPENTSVAPPATPFLTSTQEDDGRTDGSDATRRTTTRLFFQRHSLLFLKSVALSLFDVEGTTPQHLWTSHTGVAHGNAAPHHVFSPCSRSLFHTLVRLIKGLLCGSIHQDPHIKTTAQATLDAVFDRVAELLPRCPLSYDPHTQHPLVLIRCVVFCLDLVDWRITARCIQILKSCLRRATACAEQNQLTWWSAASHEQCMFCFPLLERLSEGPSVSTQGAAAYALLALMDDFPSPWVSRYFEPLAEALLIMSNTSPFHGVVEDSSLVNPWQFWAASLSGEALIFLTRRFFEREGALRCRPLWTAHPWRVLLKILLTWYVERFFHRSRVVRRYTEWLFYRLVKCLQVSPKEFLLTPLPGDLVECYGFHQDARSSDALGIFGPLDSVCSTSIRFTFLEQLILYAQHTVQRFDYPTAVALMNALQFLVLLRDVPYHNAFLSRCTCLALAALELVEQNQTPSSHSPKENASLWASTTHDGAFLQTDEQTRKQEVLFIEALRLIKLVHLHPTHQSLGGALRRGSACSSGSSPNGTESMLCPIFTSLGLPLHNIASRKCPCPGLQVLLDSVGHVNLHIARAAQHALLVLGAQEMVSTRTNTSKASFSSLFSESFLYTSLKDYLLILNDSGRKTAPHFLAFSRVMAMFKDTFQSTTVASRLVDLAFGLCNACDGLVKQLSETASSLSSGCSSLSNLLAPLTLFSPSLTLSRVPSVAMALLACFSEIHSSAFVSRHLSRSCLRLVVGLLDFVDLKLFQAQYQMRSIQSHEKAFLQKEKNTKQHPSEDTHHLRETPEDSQEVHWMHLHEAFIDFSISHALTIIQTIWMCNETASNPTGNTDTSSHTRFGLPFMLGRGKTSTFIQRGLQDPRAQALRDAMGTKTPLMSRILKERSDIKCPGFMFFAYLCGEDVSPQKQRSDGGSVSPLVSSEPVTSFCVENSTQKEELPDMKPEATSRESLPTSRAVPRLKLYEDYFSWLSQDAAGNASEDISMASVDILSILLTLHSFNFYFLWDDWVVHVWLALRPFNCVDYSNLPQKFAPVQVPAYAIFHLYPYVLDAQCVWTSSWSYALIHCVLDLWTIAAGFLFQEHPKPTTLDSKHESSTWMYEKHKLVGMFSCSTQRRLAHHYQHYAENAQHQCRPVTGLSWSSYSHIGLSGTLVSNDFHSLFHSPLGVALAHVLWQVLYASFTHHAQKKLYEMFPFASPAKCFLSSVCVNIQTIILQLKLLLALYLPLQFRVAQCYSFLHSLSCVFILVRLAPFLLRMFFRFIVFNVYLPPSFKSLIARYLIVPLLIQLCNTKHLVDINLQKELKVYFNEVIFLTPNETSRRTHHVNSQCTSLSEFADLIPLVEAVLPSCSSLHEAMSHDQIRTALCYSVVHYFELLLNRFIPDPETSYGQRPTRCSIHHLLTHEEFQMEMLRVLRYLSELSAESTDDSASPEPTPVALPPLLSTLCVSDYLVIRHWTYYYISCAFHSSPWMIGSHRPPLFTSPKMLIEFMMTLIECPQLETRFITRNSLDHLILSSRLSPETLTYHLILPSFHYFRSCEPSMPHVQILQNICQLIVRHRQFFFTMHQTLTLPSCVVLGRIAFNAGSDARRVILDVIHMLLSWELESRVNTSRLFSPHPTDSTVLGTCAYYAIKAALASVNDSLLVCRAVSGFTRCLLLSSSLVIRFHALFKSLVTHMALPMDFLHPHGVLNDHHHAHRFFFLIIQLLHVLVTFQDPEVLHHSLGLIMQTLDPLWECVDVEILEWLGVLMEHLIQRLPVPSTLPLIQKKNNELNAQSSPCDIFWKRLFQIILCGLEKALTLSPHTWTKDVNGTLPKLLLQSPEQPTQTHDTPSGSLASSYHVMNGLLTSLKHESFYSYFLSSTDVAQKNKKKRSSPPTACFSVDPYLSCRLLYALYARLPLSTETARQTVFVLFATSLLHALHALVLFLFDLQTTLPSGDHSPVTNQRYLLSEHAGGSLVFTLEHRYHLLVKLLDLTASVLFYDHSNATSFITCDFSLAVLQAYHHYSPSLKVEMQKTFYTLLLDIPLLFTHWTLRDAVLSIAAGLFFGPSKIPVPFHFKTPQTFPLPFTCKDFFTWDHLDTAHVVTLTRDTPHFETLFESQEQLPIGVLWNKLSQHRLCCFDSPHDAKQKIWQSWTPSAFNHLHLSYLLYSWADLWILRDAVQESRNLYFSLLVSVAKLHTDDLCQSTGGVQPVGVNDPAWHFTKRSVSPSFLDLSHPQVDHFLGFWVTHVHHRLRYLSRPSLLRSKKNPRGKGDDVDKDTSFIQFHAPFLNLTYPLLLGALLLDSKIHTDCLDVLREHLPTDPVGLLMAFLSLPELQRLQCSPMVGLLAQLLLLCPGLGVFSQPQIYFEERAKHGPPHHTPEPSPTRPPTTPHPATHTEAMSFFHSFQSLHWLAFTSESIAEKVVGCLIGSLWPTLTQEAQVSLAEAVVVILAYPLENVSHLELPSAASSTPQQEDVVKQFRYPRFLENIPRHVDVCSATSHIDSWAIDTEPKHGRTDCYHLSQLFPRQAASQHFHSLGSNDNESKTSPQDIFSSCSSSMRFGSLLRRLMHQKIQQPSVAPLGVTLLKVLCRCVPRAIFPYELLHYVAQHSGCWHLVLEQLIHQFLSLPSFLSLTSYGHAILNVCEAIQDTDTAHAVSYLLSLCTETRTALVNVSLGQWRMTQQQFNGYMKRLTTHTQMDLRAAQHCLASLHLGKIPLIVWPHGGAWGSPPLPPQHTCHDEMSPLLASLGLHFPRPLGSKQDPNSSQTTPPKKRSSPHKPMSETVYSIDSPLDLFLVSDTMRHEVKTWTRDWIRASTQLNQWNCLSEISSMSNVCLAQDAKSKLQDWSSIERLMACHDISTSQAAIGYFYATLQKTANAVPNHFTLAQTSLNPLVPTLPVSGYSSPLSNMNASNHFSALGSTGSTPTPPSSNYSTPLSLGGSYMTPNGAQQQPQAHFISFLHQQIKMMHRFLVVCQQLIVSEFHHRPSIPGAPHLQSFLVAQLHVEATEGLRWVVDFLRKISSSPSSPSDFPGTPRNVIENKDLISTWRSRLLSNVDDIRSWSDLLVRRNCLFTVVQSLISFCPVLPQDQQALWATYHQDVAWTILKFAQIAHSPHGLPDVALALLSKLHTLHTFFTSPAYTADYLMMLVRCVKLCQTDQERLAALNLLRGVDLNLHKQASLATTSDPLDKLKASVYLCKARLLAELPEFKFPDHSFNYDVKSIPLVRDVIDPETPSCTHDSDPPLPSCTLWPKTNLESPPHNVSDVFSELVSALELCPTLSRAWATWGIISDRVFIAQNKPTQEQDTQSTSNHKVQIEYGASAIIGYLIATYLSPAQAIRFLPRTLSLLNHDNPEQFLCRAFSRFSDIVPSSVWIMWIPQLLSNLEHREALAFYSLLNKMLFFYPQEVFYSLRSFYMEQQLTLSSLTHVELSPYKSTCHIKNHCRPVERSVTQSTQHTPGTEPLSSTHTMATYFNNLPMNHDNTSEEQRKAYAIAAKQAVHLSSQLLTDVSSSTAAPLCMAMENLSNLCVYVSLSIGLDEIIHALQELQHKVLSLPFSQETLPMSYSVFLYERIIIPALDICFVLNVDSQNDFSTSEWSNPCLPMRCSKGLFHHTLYSPRPKFSYIHKLLSRHFSQFQKDFFIHLHLKNKKDSIFKEPNEAWDSTYVRSKTRPTDWMSWTREHCLHIIQQWIILWSFYTHHSLKPFLQQFIHMACKPYCINTIHDATHRHMPLRLPGIHLFQPIAYHTLKSHPSTTVSCEANHPSLIAFKTFEIADLSFDRDHPQCRFLLHVKCYNGTRYTFAIHRSTNLFQQRSEQRNMYMLYHMNYCLLLGKESRRRSLVVPLTLSTPIHPFLTLIGVTNQSSLADISVSYHDHHSLSGLSHQMSLQNMYLSHAHKVAKRLQNKADQTTPTSRADTTKGFSNDILLEAAKSAYYRTLKEVPQHILLSYLSTSFPDPQRFFFAQERLAADTALWCLLGFIYFTADSFTPEGLIFDLSASRLGLSPSLTNTVYPPYDMKTFSLEQSPHHAVSSCLEHLELKASSTFYPPFRLTPNLLHMNGLVKRLGVMPNALLASIHALALHTNRQILQTIFSILIRDDLYSRAVFETITTCLVPNSLYTSQDCPSALPSNLNLHHDSNLDGFTPDSQFIRWSLSHRFDLQDTRQRATYDASMIHEKESVIQPEIRVDPLNLRNSCFTEMPKGKYHTILNDLNTFIQHKATYNTNIVLHHLYQLDYTLPSHKVSQDVKKDCQTSQNTPASPHSYKPLSEKTTTTNTQDDTFASSSCDGKDPNASLLPKIFLLLEAASSFDNHALMKPSWTPWF